jgi:outer membrane lipoprotein-sorting protein
MSRQSTDRSENEMPDDALRRAIASIQGEAVPPGPPAELIATTLRVLRESENTPQSSLPFFPRTTMMKLMTTAAGLLLTIGAVTMLMLASKAPSSAFGQAIKQVREARSMSYAELLTIKDRKEPVRTKVFIAEDGRRRSEMPSGAGSDGVVTIFDATGYVRITLIEPSKTALVYEAKRDEAVKARGDFLAWLQALKKLGDKPDRELGQKELDGKQVTGFVATQGTFTFTMWVDQATGQPVRIEYDPPVTGAGYEHVAMTDFRFGEKLDESLFSFDVPAGYKVQQQPLVPAVPGGEASIIEALHGWTKRSGGTFPSSLTDWGIWAVEFSKDSRDGKIAPEAMGVLAHLGAITPFLVSMPKNSYAYLGEGRSVDQAGAIVFWYQKPDGTYRAIYGDLSAKDVDANDIPKK